MDAPSEDIKDVLVAGGIGTFAATTGWCISIGLATDITDSMIILYDTTGGSPVICFDKTVAEMERAGLMIHVRAFGYKTAHTKLMAIMTLLGNLYREHWTALNNSDTYYQVISRQGNPMSLGQDDRGRDLWSVNYRVARNKQ